MRPTPQQKSFTPAPLALAVAMALALAAGHAPLAHAQSGAATAAATPMAINIPAQPLGQALNELARQANLQMTFPAALVAGKQAPAVSGQLTVRQALERVLAGSGLAANVQGASVVVREAPAPQAGESTLPVVTVTAGADAPTARGNAAGTEYVSPVIQAGILGDRPAVEVPFTIQSYTKDIIEEQQSSTLAKALRSDAGVNNVQNAGGAVSGIDIRGFGVFGTSWDGLYGGFSHYYGRFPLQFVEAVEVIKGPSALLFGAGNPQAPAGLVNYVPKRPPATASTPIRRVAIGTESGGAISVSADLGGRFGPDASVGYRLNAFGRKGGLAVDDIEDDSKGVLASFDWNVTRDLKLTADLGAVDSLHTGGTNYPYQVASGVQIPAAPEGSLNVGQPWNYWTTDRRYGLIKAEWSFAPDWTLSAVATRTKTSFDLFEIYPVITDSLGNAEFSTGDGSPFEATARTYQATLAGKLKTGGIGHQLSFGYTRDYETAIYASPNSYTDVTATNIYRPIRIPRPVGVPTGATPSAYTDLTIDTVRLVDVMTWGPWTAVAGLGKVTINEAIPDSSGNAYKQSKNTPLAAVLYKLNPNTSVYASYAEGFLKGGTAPMTGVSNPNQQMPPITTDQIELGLKQEWGSMLLQAAMFRINRPLEYVDPVTTAYVQDGRQRHEGLELSIAGPVTSDINLVASAMLLRPRVSNDQFNGNRPTGVPERSLSLYGTWRLPIYRPLTLSAGMQYKSAQAFDLANTQTIKSYTVFDLGATLDMKAAWAVPGKLRLAVDNVADRAYWSSPGYGGGLSKGDPRTVKLSASFDF